MADDDTAGVMLSETTRTVAENGGTATYTVVLDSEPLSNVVVTVFSLNQGNAKVRGPGGSGFFQSTQLTFMPSNWNMAQTVTVKGQNDDIDNAANRTATIRHTVTAGDTGGKYTNSLTISNLSVTVTDDDTKGLVITPDPVSVNEGDTGSYTVKLATRPTGNVTVSISGHDTTDLEVDGPDAGMTSSATETLTFTPSGAGVWSTPQTVNLSANDDTDANDDTVTLTHDVSGGGYDTSQDKDLTVTITDDEGQSPIISIALPTPENAPTKNGVQKRDETGGTTGVAFELAADRSLPSSLTVCVEVEESGGDRVASGSEGIQTVSMSSSGNVNGAGSHTVTWTNTAADDRDSTVTVTVVAPDTAGCSGAGAYRVSSTEDDDEVLIEDDDATSVELTSSDDSMTEGNASATATLTIELGRQLYAGEVIVAPFSWTTSTGARLPGSEDGSMVANHDFTVTASGNGVTITNEGTANPRITFTGHDTNTVQTATVTLTPVASRDDGDRTDETITATLGTTFAGAGLATNVGGGAERDATNYAEDITLVDDDKDSTAPRVTSIARQSPSTSPTNADTLVWRVTFSEVVVNVGTADFEVGGTTATITGVSQVSATNAYDVTASGGNLANRNNTVTLSFASAQDIQDTSSNALTNTTPTGTNHRSFVLDNTAPRVTSIVWQSPSRSPTDADSLTWRVTFNEAVQNVGAADFQVSGTTASLAATKVTNANAWDITASGGNLANRNNTVTLSFASAQDIEDEAGNALTNTTPMSTNNSSFVVSNPTVVTIAAGVAVTEGTAASFTVTSTPAPTANLTVNLYVTQSGSFVASGNRGVKSVTVPTSGSATYTVATQGDSADEADGGVTVTVLADTSSPMKYTAGSAAAATVTVKDNDPTVVSLARTGSGAVTEGGKVEFTVTLARALVAGEIIDAPLSISGTNVTTSDWSLAKKSGGNTGVSLSDQTTATPKVRFEGAGARVATLELTATADGTAESGGETFTIALGSNSAFDASTLGTNVGGGADPHGTNNSFNVTVNDPVAPTLSLGLGSTSGNEGDSSSSYVNVKISLAPTRSAATAFKLCVKNTGTATFRTDSGSDKKDFDLVNSGNDTGLTVDSSNCHAYSIGGGSGSSSVRLRIFGDTTPEADETAVLELRDAPGGVEISATAASATYTITNDDIAKPAGFTVTASDAQVELSWTDPGNSTITAWQYRQKAGTGSYGSWTDISGSTATTTSHTVSSLTNGTEYTFRIRARAGAIEGAASDEVSATPTAAAPAKPAGFTATAGDAQVALSWTDPANSAITKWQYWQKEVSGPQGAWHDVPASTATTTSHTVAGLTNGVNYLFRVRAVAGTAEGAQSEFEQVMPTGGTTAPGKPADFTATAGNAQVALSWTDPGNSAITAWQYRQKAGTGSYGSWTDISGSTATTTSHTVSSLTNGTEYTFQIRARAGAINGTTSDAASATPAGGNTAPTLANQIPDRTATVGTAFSYVFAANTFEDADNDPLTYSAVKSDGSSLPGWLSFDAGTRTFSGTPAAADTGTVAVQVTASDGNSGTVTDTFDIVVSATAPPTTAEITITGGPAVTEGNPASFTVSASPVPASAVTVNLNVTQSGSFVTGANRGTRTVRIAAGSASVNYAVDTVDDSTDEANGSVTVTVTSGTNYTVGSPSAATVRVNDDDVPSPTTPTVAFAASTSSISERGGTRTISITLSPAPSAPITLSYTLGGSAAENDDFTISGAGSVAVAAGSSSAAIAVSVVDSRVDEDAETVVVTLTGSGSGYTLGNRTSHTLTIVDHDTAGIRLSSSALRLMEKHSFAEYTVVLASEPTAAVAVRVRSGDAALVSASTGALTFNAGNWDEPQPVTLTAEAVRGRTDISHEASSADSKYQNLSRSLPVEVGQNPVSAAAAWLVRFVRTQAAQVLDSIAERMRTSPESEVTVAGHAVEISKDYSNETGRPPAADVTDLVPIELKIDVRSPPRTVSPDRQQLLTGSSFSLSDETAQDGSSWSVWGRGAVSEFEGIDGALELEGDAETLLAGTELREDEQIIGVVVAHSKGEGQYRGAEDVSGSIDAELTSVTPWVSFAPAEGLSVWAALGIGQGELQLKAKDASVAVTDTHTRTVAFGIKGTLIEAPPTDGFGLDIVSDALWLEAKSARSGLLLAATASELSRLRVRLEGTWNQSMANAAQLDTRLDLGVRLDGGDAERGLGAEAGGGIVWRDGRRGVSVGLSGRSVISHEDKGFERWNAEASVAYDPKPASDLGLSLSLKHQAGTQSTSEMEALFQADSLRAYQQDQAPALTQRLAAQAGYGVPLRGYTATPYIEYGRSKDSRDYTLGWSVAPADSTTQLQFGVKATRTRDNTSAPNDAIGLELRVKW